MTSGIETAEASSPIPGERPKVLLVITKADIGGAQIHLLQILHNLSGQYQFLLATGEEGFLVDQARNLGVRVEIIPSLVRPIRPLRDIAAARATLRLIRGFSPDLIHAHSFKAGVIARIVALLARTPCLFTAHGWAFTPGAPSVQRLLGLAMESVLCRLCRGVVTICRHDYELAARWKVGAESRRHLVRNAADPVPATSLPGREPVTLVTIGRLTPVKNQKLILHAMTLLPGNITLTIIGDGSLKQDLSATISKLALGDRVTLAGEMVDPGQSLAAATLFIMSSDFEGLPISILEAMSAGLPVVSTDVGGVAEAVIDGESGFLVPRGDFRQLAGKIQILADDPDLRQRMGSRGREHYQQHFTTSRFTSEMREVYQKLLNP